MKLLPNDDGVASAGGVRFRHSPLGPAVLLLICLCGAVGVEWWLISDGAYVGAAVMGLAWTAGVLVALGWLLVTLAKTNWVLVVAKGGLYVNLRSYLNRKAARCVGEVAHIAFSEIKHVHKTSIRSEMTREDGQTATQHHHRLDIVLRQEDTEAVRQAVASLAAAVPKLQLRYQHSPVLLPNARTLRIEWVRGMTKCLEQFVKVESPLLVQKSDNDAESAIISRVECGNIIDAVRLVRQRYGMNLTEAKEFVQQLSQKDGRE